MLLRITPTALEEYSPVLMELKNKNTKNKQTNKQTNSNHWERILTVEVNCVISFGERFSPISTFFFLVSSRAFRDAPHSRFRCRDPNQCLPNFLKVLLLALPQIYIRVFHRWKTIDLHSIWVVNFRSYQLSFLP